MKYVTPRRHFPRLLLLNFLKKFLAEGKYIIKKFNLCEAKISLDEIIKSINSQRNEPPANNGLTAELYKKHFFNKLVPGLLDTYELLFNNCYIMLFLE